MPSLTHTDREALNGIVNAAADLLVGDVDADNLEDAIDLLSKARQALIACDNPDGILPVDLQKGHRIEIDSGQWLVVIGAPWRTKMGNQILDEIVAVPLSGGEMAFLPAGFRVTVR